MMRTVISKLFLYGMFISSVAVVIYFLAGCAAKRDMSSEEALGIIQLDKELRK